MSDIAIQIENVCKRFGPTLAVNEVSLQIRSGEFFSLLGPSGCGKTTILRMIAGFETPCSGRILVSGQDITGVPPHKRPVNMVFQNYALFPHLSVFENVAFGLRCLKSCPVAEIRTRVEQALELVGLEKFQQRLPGQISGGQQQRVALARAVVNRPAVLLLDEPLSALDLKIRQEMQDELSRLQKELKMTFVMVTHDQGEALALSNRIAVFYQGHLEQLGCPEVIYERPKSAFVADFIGNSNLLSAVVKQKLPARLQVETPEGLSLWVSENPEFNTVPGAKVLVWVRRQSIRLRAAANNEGASSPLPESNEFTARIASKSYQGDSTDYIVVVAGKNESCLRVLCGDLQHKLFEPGQEVVVSIPISKISVLPATTSGIIPEPQPVAVH